MDVIKAPDGVSDALYEKVTWMQIGVIRKDRKIKQGDISDVTGIAQTTLSHIEHGRMVPSEHNQHVLATYFHRNDWREDKNFDWEKQSYSSNNLTLFIHQLQNTIDWSKYQHLVAVDIGVNEDLQNVLKKRGSLRKGFDDPWDKANWDKAVNDLAASRYDAPEPKRIPKYSHEHPTKGVDFVEDGVLIDDNADTVVAPHNLQNREGAYALVVNSMAMYPKYELGDTVYADPVAIPMRGDDVVIQLKYADRTVAIVRHVIGMHIDEGGIYCGYDLEPIYWRGYAEFMKGQHVVEMRITGDEATDEDMNEVYTDTMKQVMLTLGIDDEGQCHHISGNQNADPEDRVIEAAVHVIVGSERKYVSNAIRASSHPLESKKHKMSAASGKFGMGGYGVGLFGGKKG